MTQPMPLGFKRSPKWGWQLGARPHLFKDGGMWCVSSPAFQRMWFPTFYLAAHYARHVPRSVRG